MSHPFFNTVIHATLALETLDNRLRGIVKKSFGIEQTGFLVLLFFGKGIAYATAEIAAAANFSNHAKACGKVILSWRQGLQPPILRA